MFTIVKPLNIYFLQIITLGFYFYYWCARSGGEVNRLLKTQSTPSAWWFLVPFVGAYWWVWKYSEALNKATNKQIKKQDTFLIFLIAVNLWTAIIWVLDFLLDFIHKDALVFVVLAVLLFIYFTICISYAIFCAVIQNKINKLPKKFLLTK